MPTKLIVSFLPNDLKKVIDKRGEKNYFEQTNVQLDTNGTKCFRINVTK